MTHGCSALLAQLDSLKSADAGAVFAELIRVGMRALIEAEGPPATKISAGRYERCKARETHRNGHRSRTLSTTSGDIEVKIPKLRSDSFFLSLLQPRRRIGKALQAVIMVADVHGVSTRSVDDLAAALGVDSGISKSEVSRICAGLDREIEAFYTRSLHHTAFGTCSAMPTLLQGPRRSPCGLPGPGGATRISAEGTREVLGTAVGDSESYEFWREFLGSFTARGLFRMH